MTCGGWDRETVLYNGFASPKPLVPGVSWGQTSALGVVVWGQWKLSSAKNKMSCLLSRMARCKWCFVERKRLAVRHHEKKVSPSVFERNKRDRERERESVFQVLMSHDVAKGDVFRMCLGLVQHLQCEAEISHRYHGHLGQTKDGPIQDWVKLAVARARATNVRGTRSRASNLCCFFRFSSASFAEASHFLAHCRPCP